MTPILDVVLVIVLLGALITGLSRGLFASAGSLIGLVVGGALAWWLLPIANAWLATTTIWTQARTLIVVVLAIVLIGVCVGLGAALGRTVRRGVRKIKLGAVDRLLGGVLSVLVGALMISLIGGGVTQAGIPFVSSAVGSSTVVRTIDSLIPAPLARGLGEVRQSVLADGLPRLGDLLEGAAAPTAPPIALDDPALNEAAQSVARITGTAYACGVQSTGSGFVIAADRVVTNAHVVAGVSNPVIELPGRASVDAQVVYFDSQKDIAVLATRGLDARVLPLGAKLTAGASAAFQGYPYGGPFTSGTASVRSVGTALVPDLSDSQRSARDVYALDADVRPGNSGGPLLDASGQVAGIVFARADDGSRVGYAMTTDELAPVYREAESLSTPVATGSCTTH